MNKLPDVIPEDLPEDTKKRLPAIMEALSHGKNNEEIAAQLAVSKYVIAYDRLLWRQSAGYEVWVYEEFHRLHTAIADQHPIVAYKEMGKLLGRIFAQKIKAEIKAKGGIKVDIEAGESIKTILGDYENAIDKAVKEIVERALSKDGAGEQVDSAKAPSETS